MNPLMHILKYLKQYDEGIPLMEAVYITLIGLAAVLATFLILMALGVLP